MREPPLPGSPAGRVVVALKRPPRDIDPRFVLDTTTAQVSRLVFAGLVSVDNSQLEPRPLLAERVAPDLNDPTVWHVRLRPGLRFGDGAPLTAHDVAFTYRSILDPATRSPLRAEFAARIAAIEEDPGDPLAVTFRLRAPLATFATDLVIGIVPAHLLQQRPDHRFRPDEWVGCGPFAVETKRGDQTWVLRRSPTWFDAPPPHGVERIVFRVLPDPNVRALGLLAGSVDLVEDAVSPLLVDTVAHDPRVRLIEAPSIAFTYLGLNLRKPALADVRVRRALSAAIDRSAIVRHLYAGRADVARGMFAPFHWAAAPDLPAWDADPQTARRLLDEAGLAPDPATGVRMHLLLEVSADRFRRNVAELIARGWRAVGVDTDVRAFEFATFFADVRAGRFDAFILQLPEPIEPDMLRWMFDSLSTPQAAGDPDSPSPFARADRRAFRPGLAALLASSCGGHHAEDTGDECCGWAHGEVSRGLERLGLRLSGWTPPRGTANRTGFYDPRFDCLVQRGRHVLDRAKRRALYVEAQRIVARAVPIVPLWYERHVALARRRLEGYVIPPNGGYWGLVRASLRR